MLELQTLLEAVETRARRITGADGPSEIFHTLLDGAALAAPHSGLYLVRKGRVKGWGTRGRDREAAERFQAFTCDVGEGWPGALAAPGGPETAVRPDGVTETLGFAVRLGGKALAVIELERDPGEKPWHPEIVSLLVQVAEIRLELDLARRKIDRLSGSTPAGERSASSSSFSEPPTMDPGSSRDPGPPTQDRSTGPAAATGEEPGTDAGLAPATGGGTGEKPEHDAARRFARLVATDIRLYNEEAVMLGRKHRDLVKRLKDQLDQGSEAFQRRFPDIGPAGEEILRNAFVQVLAAGDRSLFSGSA